MGWGRGSQGMRKAYARVLRSDICVDGFQEKGDEVLKAAFPSN